ncbi:MAG TPA: hypothetical protein VFO10_13900 [Oligoflexus sp.]|uniref:hypothetical protein n=1 Tax=Oligoflexus sp. TaxID=1971216 RepID=UPI002D7EBBEF|nr:hypothetical protein [Oligoflexus sp.]HET9238349.1 hypothetical protein [Oligoflexus sp.]
MFKSSILLNTLILALALGACENRKIEKTSLELDPAVAAEVKRINMERFAGSWLKEGEETSLYLELGDEGYDVLVEDRDGVPVLSDFGAIDHYKPGLMILKTARPECEADGIVYLKMDQHDGAVRLLDTKDKNYSAALLAVPSREQLRIASLPCLPLD